MPFWIWPHPIRRQCFSTRLHVNQGHNSQGVEAMAAVGNTAIGPSTLPLPTPRPTICHGLGPTGCQRNGLTIDY